MWACSSSRLWRGPPISSKTPTTRRSAWRQRRPVAADSGDQGSPEGNWPNQESGASSSSGGSSSSSSSNGGGEEQRRPGPSSPNDTLLRASNRDRMLGLLTDRAARTLLYYLMELNPTVHNWLFMFLKDNEIPADGHWRDVSGETLLLKLLSMPVEQTKYGFGGRDELFSCAAPIGVDPRNLAQRIMEIRSQIAKEWAQELEYVSEENAIIMREYMVKSLGSFPVAVAGAAPGQGTLHPEMAEMYESADAPQPDDSAGGGDD